MQETKPPSTFYISIILLFKELGQNFYNENLRNLNYFGKCNVFYLYWFGLRIYNEIYMYEANFVMLK